MTADAAARRMLVLLGMASFTSMASMRICDAMLPVIAAEFAVTTGRAAKAVSAFAVAYGVSQVFFGPMGDRFGKYRVVSGAVLACTVGSALAAASSSMNWLLCCRLLSGAAAAGIIPLTMAWVGDGVAYERRQEVLARLLGFTVVGMIAGQWLGGLIADTLGWRDAFGLLALLFAGCAALLMSQARGAQAEPVHAVDASTLQRFRAVLSQPWARRVLAVTFVEGALVFGTIAFIASHLHDRFGVSMSVAGGALAMYGVGGFIYSRFARRLLARLGEARLALLGACCLALAFGGLAAIADWRWALPACGVAGFGFYALHNTLQTHATQMAPSARGTAVSLFSCLLFLGQSIGMLLAAQVVDRVSTNAVFAGSSAGLLALGLSFAAMLHRRATHPSARAAPVVGS